jgi:hypothetical protein
LTEPANESKPKSKKQPKNKPNKNSAKTTAFLLSDTNSFHQKTKTKYPRLNFNLACKLTALQTLVTLHQLGIQKLFRSDLDCHFCGGNS